MTTYRLIAIDKRKKGGYGKARISPESFIVECNEDLNAFMDKWEIGNPFYRALHMSTYLDKNKFKKTGNGNHW